LSKNKEDADKTKEIAPKLRACIAESAAQGKRIRKKDLGMIATTYGYVYVAQIAMGADHAQTLKAIREAEELFAEAQKMAQLRYKTYVRKTQEDWSNE